MDSKRLRMKSKSFMDTHHTEVGTICKPVIPHSERRGLYDGDMSGPLPREILWTNVTNLMVHRYGAMNHNRLAELAKIGNGTVTRLQRGETSIGTVESIAKLFKLEVWHLFLPDLRPENPPVGAMTAEQAKMLEQHRAVRQAIAEVPAKEAPALPQRTPLKSKAPRSPEPHKEKL